MAIQWVLDRTEVGRAILWVAWDSGYKTGRFVESAIGEGARKDA